MAITLRIRGECHPTWLSPTSFTIANGSFFLRSDLGTPVDDPPTIHEVYVDGVSAEFTQTRSFAIDQYYTLDVTITSYTEDLEQHEIRLVRYARDDVSGEEIYQNHFFYTQFKEQKLLTMIGNHLFRDEVFEKPIDIYLGLMTSLNPLTEVVTFCTGVTEGTELDAPTGYERKWIRLSEFGYVYDPIVVNPFGGTEYTKNNHDIVFNSFTEECTIVGLGVFLSPFDTYPVFTSSFAYPINYTAKSPDPVNLPDVENWMSADVVIRSGRLQFQLQNEAISNEMKRLIAEHLFLEEWTGGSLAADYRLSTKPTGFYLGLITEIENDLYFIEPTRTGSAYTRIFYESGDEQWRLDGDGVYKNSVAITFPTPTADWGTVIGYAVYRINEFNSANPNEGLLFYKPLPAPVTISSGIAYTLAVNAITIEIA